MEDAREHLIHVRDQQRRAREELHEAEEAEAEKERQIRHEKFLEDVDTVCFLCRDKFSNTTGTPSFSVLSYKCDCTGNARMVHLGCWVSFPPGQQQKCGICKSAASLVDPRGRKFKVSVEVEVVDLLADSASADDGSDSD